MTAIERGELPPPCTLQLLALLKEAEPATIGHFHDRGFLHGRIKAMAAVARSVGTAVTVRCEGSDGSILHRGLSARTTRAGGQSGSFCRPVDCGGVRVHPGDAVLADENGVLVMPPDQAWDLARKAIGLQQAEQQTLARLRAGESYSDVLDTRLVFQ
ncbi:MAG: RraA family protein, partial [Variovorax paradoxus]